MRFIVIGCGRMGAGLSQTLSRRGHAVTVLDRDPDALARLDRDFPGRILQGSGLDQNVLVRAGIHQADGLAAVTHSDEANVVLARLARLVFQVPRVVSRLVDPRKADIYHRLGIHVVAPIAWAACRIADLLSYSELDPVLSLGGGEVEILQVEVPSMLAGSKVSTLTIPGEAQVVSLTRRGRAFLPSSETILHKEDVMHLAVLATSIERIRSMLSLS